MTVAKNQKKRQVLAREQNRTTERLVGRLQKLLHEQVPKLTIEIITDAPQISASLVSRSHRMTLDEDYDGMMDAGSLF